MKKPRLGLLGKIMILTGGLTILTLSASLIASVLITSKNKKDDFIDSCVNATNVIESTFTTASAEKAEGFESIINILIENYSAVSKTYDSLTPQQITDYQNNLRIQLFGPADGSAIGMSYDRALRKNYYQDALINMQGVCSTYSVPFSAFTLYDITFNRAITISKSNISLEDNLTSIGLASSKLDNDEIAFFESGRASQTFSDNDVVYAYKRVAFKNIIPNYACFVQAEYPLAEFNKANNEQILLELLITVGSGIFLVIIYAIFARIFLIKNIKKLSLSTDTFVEKMKNDETLEIIDSKVNSNDEVKDLSNKFMTMQEQIITYVDNIKTAKSKEQRFLTEVGIASKIQLESLPAGTFFDRNLEIRALIQPAKMVGGDFYDYFYTGNNRIAFVIADVSGKGIPASLFMMRAKESIKSACNSEKNLSDVFFKVNNSLAVNNKEGFFVTAFLGVLDLTTFKLDYINAGHERPFYKHNGDTKQLMINSNFVLGLEEDFRFEQEEVQLEKDDELFLFTDGLNEAINHKQEEYGYSRIQNMLCKDGNIKEKINDTIKDLESFRGEEEQFDDITIFSIKIRPEVHVIEIDNPSYQTIEEVTNRVDEYLCDVDLETVSKINVIIDEAINNIVSYGKAKTNKKIIVQVEKNNGHPIIIFIDNSHPFNPLSIGNRTVQENLDAGIVGGLGVSIIRSISKETEYVYSNNRNILIVKM